MERPTVTRAAILALALIAGCAEELPETPPRQLAGSPFHYPEQLWDAGVEGETLLRLFVTEAGRVDTARVERSSGHPEFDSAAVSGAHDLRFEPALREQQPVGVWVLLPVQFELPDSVDP
jgi:protein TonB